MKGGTYKERVAGYKRLFRKPKGYSRTPPSGPVASYEGFSVWNENSTAASFHQAVLAAAAEAAEDSGRAGIELPAWFEVTRVRILVGNPNVKVYGATVTKSDPPG